MHPQGKHSAFTLIELLVVVTIIALLMAVLMPAVNGGLDQARIAGSLANLRQIGIAVEMSLQDRNGEYPAAVYTASNAWLRVLYPVVYFQPWPDFQPHATADNIRRTIFWSPMLKPSEPTPHRAFAWNSYLGAVRAGTIEQPEATCLAADGDRTSELWFNRVSFRNQGKANVLFADLHVASTDPSEIPTSTTLAVFWRGR